MCGSLVKSTKLGLLKSGKHLPLQCTTKKLKLAEPVSINPTVSQYTRSNKHELRAFPDLQGKKFQITTGRSDVDKGIPKETPAAKDRRCLKPAPRRFVPRPVQTEPWPQYPLHSSSQQRTYPTGLPDR